MGRGKESGSPAGVSQDRFGHRRNAPFPVGAGDMQDGKFLVRIPQLSHQGPDTIQSQVNVLNLVPPAIEEVQGLSVVHLFQERKKSSELIR
jgi:hypothetical protein